MPSLSKRTGTVIVLLLIFIGVLTLIKFLNLDMLLVVSVHKLKPLDTGFSEVIWNVYKYGPYLSLLLGIVMLYFFIGSFFYNKFRPLRKKTAFAILLLVLGPGLLVQTVKNVTGRPRPRELTSIGGTHEFRSALEPSFRFPKYYGDKESFPSGHAATGFYPLVLCLFIYRKRHALIMSGSWGLLMSTVRIMQQAHFLSDIIASFFVVYLVGYLLSMVLFREESTDDACGSGG